MAGSNIQIFENSDLLTSQLCIKIKSIATDAITRNGRFTVGLSGGSLSKFLCKGLSNCTDIAWSKWSIFFCDERYVSCSDPDSNYFAYKSLFTSISEDVKIYPAFEESEPLSSLDEATKQYVDALKKTFVKEDAPSFDLLLLGMGPDGHTCSLFPNHPALNETNQLIVKIEDSPKPPPCRITMTLPVLNNAKNIIFVCCGKDKADNLRDVLKNNHCNLPAAKVQLTSGNIYWMLDQAAASNLA